MRRLNRIAGLLLVSAAVLSSVTVSAKPKKTENVSANAPAGMVVVTAKGKKYHKPDCRTVKRTYRILTVEEARSKGYTPCKICIGE